MPDKEISKYLAYLLAAANRRMHIGLTFSIAPEELSEEHWRILQVVSNGQGCSMGNLAVMVLLNHPALTKNIDKLVSRGLVQRAADAYDNRKVLVYITDLGLETVARLTKSVDMHHETIQEALGQRKTNQLKRLLESFIKESEPQ